MHYRGRPQRQLAMGLSFAPRYWGKSDDPGCSERTAMLGKIPDSFVHRTQIVNGAHHTTVIAITK